MPQHGSERIISNFLKLNIYKKKYSNENSHNEGKTF